MSASTSHADALDLDGDTGDLFPAGSEEERDLHQNRRDLRTFDALMAVADSLPDQQAELVEGVAWSVLEDATPARHEVARIILSVPAELVSRFVDEGVLDAVDSSQPKVTLDSVIEAKAVIEEMRELGKNEDLVAAVLSRLELEDLQGDDRFIESLEQMRRGERGQWPARYRM